MKNLFLERWQLLLLLLLRSPQLCSVPTFMRHPKDEEVISRLAIVIDDCVKAKVRVPEKGAHSMPAITEPINWTRRLQSQVGGRGGSGDAKSKELKAPYKSTTADGAPVLNKQGGEAPPRTAGSCYLIVGATPQLPEQPAMALVAVNAGLGTPAAALPHLLKGAPLQVDVI